jgi:hypothetical protein
VFCGMWGEIFNEISLVQVDSMKLICVDMLAA